MLWICVIIGLAVTAVVILPFARGEGGLLAEAGQVQSRERLLKLKAEIVARYVADEAAFRAESMGARTWKGRRQFLQNRFVDVARRLDFLATLEVASPEGKT